MSGPRIVTGANGLLGRGYLRAGGTDGIVGLHRAGASIDDLPTAMKAGLRASDYDPTRLEEALVALKPSEIVHCAGMPAVFASLRDPVADHRNNFEPVLYSAELARRTGARLSLVSSAEIYGPASGSRDEAGAPDPQNFYGVSKAFCEAHVTRYAAVFGIPALILRPSVLIGPGLKRNVLFDLVSGFRDRKDPVTLFCDPRSSFDFLHVDELVGAHDWLLAQGRATGIWNVASGEEVSVEALVEWLSKHFGHRPKLEIREDHLQKKTLAATKLAHAGWKPKRSFWDYLKDWVLAKDGVW